MGHLSRKKDLALQLILGIIFPPLDQWHTRTTAHYPARINIL